MVIKETCQLVQDFSHEHYYKLLEVFRSINSGRLRQVTLGLAAFTLERFIHHPRTHLEARTSYVDSKKSLTSKKNI